MFRATVSALILSLAALPAFAADNGFYLGVGVGQAGIDLSEEDIGTVGESFSGDDTAYKAIVGFRPLDFLAFEANYIDLGTASDNIQGIPIDIDATGIDVFAVGILPVSMVDLYAKVGYIFWDADVSAQGFSEGDSGEDFAYGVGVGLHFGSFGARLEYERFEIQDTDTVDLISVGLTYTFL
jgi:hypothetical protein